jgi:succinate dehydrogenase hydrophobic anchor subunit
MNLRTAPQRGVNFDYIMWLYARLSALAMYLVALIGITGALIMGARQEMTFADLMRWAFTPEVSHVLNTNVPNIDAWKTIFWHIMGTLMILLAGAHGYHGFLNVLDDYVKSATARVVLRVVVIVLWILMSIVAIYLLLTS